LVESVGAYQTFVKPLIDIGSATILLIVLAPLLLVAAALVRVFIGSPVLFRQTRIGKGGEPFELLKLRTMIPDRRQTAVEYDGPERRQAHKSPDDPRVLPVGAVLRAVRLDELPQLWNVIRGDMSMVGPRPELPEIVSSYQDWQHHRHVVKPGLTGLWQVSAPDGRLMHECTELDLEYIEEMGLGTDFSIMLRTPAAMLRRRGF
jgi:lipopolysaccharide/colanic/teichoic acid biosynthesis glycosyltransferase